MEAEDIAIGQKVKPLQRTMRIGIVPATHSYVWRVAQERNQDFLYVLRIQDNFEDGIPRVLCCHVNPLVNYQEALKEADWFQDVDLCDASDVGDV